MAAYSQNGILYTTEKKQFSALDDFTTGGSHIVLRKQPDIVGSYWMILLIQSSKTGNVTLEKQDNSYTWEKGRHLGAVKFCVFIRIVVTQGCPGLLH